MSTALGPSAGVPDAVAQQAVEWLVELQSDPPVPAARERLERWLAEHPDHRRAWHHIEDVNYRLHGLVTPQRAALAHATLVAPRGRSRRGVMKAFALLVVAGGGAMAVGEDTTWRGWVADLRTVRGERRQLVLDDGTRLWMHGETAVDVRFGPSERRLRLIRGEVLLQTASDAQGRPFVVETAEGEARPLGTRFTVRQLDGESQVAVYEGRVAVRSLQGADAVVLPAGRRASFSASHVGAPEAAREEAAAWVDGLIVARSLRLDDFLAELSRHSALALSCEPAVAGLRVSGSYPVADVGRVLAAVSATLSLQVEDTPASFWRRQSAGKRLVAKGELKQS